jgi:hypothetical protein
MGTELEFDMTRHAQCRSQQRGVRPEVLSFVISQADVWLYANGGLEIVRLSRKRLRQLSREGIDTSLIERATNVVVIYEPENGSVVTVLHDHASGNGRQYRKQGSTRNNRIYRRGENR